MTIRFEMMTDGRDKDLYNPNVTRMVIENLRESESFEDNSSPYTPTELIAKMMNKIGDISGKKALVFYTLEMALALKEANCEDVTVITTRECRLTRQLVSDIGYDRYMLLDEIREAGVKYDLIIGNPPYQKSQGTGSPIWQEFVNDALDNLVRGGGSRNDPSL